MRRVLLVAAQLLMLVGAAGVALAQRDCGDGLPCGKLYWDLPVLPTLFSPTPMPTIQITAVQTSTPAPTGAASATPAPTGTLQADFSQIGNQFSTLQAVVNATSVPVLVSGTPMSPSDQLVELGDDAGTFFGYARGFSEASLGGWSPFIALLVLSSVIVLGIKSLSFILPIAAVLFRLILRIIEVVKQLIGL